MVEHKSKYGIRLSLENCSHYKNVHVLPIYAASNIVSSEFMPILF